jgi:cytochrome c oxidase assembly factor CtaG
MLEHELLMLAAAPLLVMSRPLALMLWAFPAAGRQGLGAAARSGWIQSPWRALTEPWTATALQAAALWLWHLPTLFDRALASEAWHAAQHLSFLVTALLFWTAVLPPDHRRGLARSIGCLFLTSLVSGALGAFMALSSSPWYERYAELGMTPQGLLGGLTPSEDQQLAGLLMWIPGGMVHAAAALALLGSALRLPGLNRQGSAHGLPGR